MPARVPACVEWSFLVRSNRLGLSGWPNPYFCADCLRHWDVCAVRAFGFRQSAAWPIAGEVTIPLLKRRHDGGVRRLLRRRIAFRQRIFRHARYFPVAVPPGFDAALRRAVSGDAA
jgi:hypothetical protein